MIEALGPVGLISATAALLALPVMPAFYEMRKRGDVAPLPTSRHDGRIENFAEAFRCRIEHLFPQLEENLNQRVLSRINSDGMEVLLVGQDDFDFDATQIRGLAAVLGSQLTIPSSRTVAADVYAAWSLNVGPHAAVRAALAVGNITLAENSAALRWMHSDSTVYLRNGSASYGRLSAFEAIHLEPGCSFQRMHAPHITTEKLCDAERSAQDAPDSDVGISVAPESRPMSFPRPVIYAGNAFLSRPRVRAHGDFVLPEGETMNANVIATGSLRFGPGSRFVGSAKSYKDTIVEEGASIEGSIVCGGTLQVGPRCFIAGPVMAEQDVVISQGVRVGTPDALTTISSSGARIATGCRLHGTVWARVRGTVED